MHTFPSGHSNLDEVLESGPLRSLSKAILAQTKALAENSRTAKLWLLYMEYIEVVKLFIRSERMGSWHDHLVAATQMLNLFAATGHYNYAKSTRLYLQMIQKLHESHPWLYE